jgi:hypothetical protein
VRLSKQVGGNLGGTSLTFQWPAALLAKISSSTQLTGPGIPNGETFTFSGNVATLSIPITAAANPANSTTDLPYQIRGTPFTFWTPWTDTQAAALSMDFLGIQAAEQAAEIAGGGMVYAPSGTYIMNGDTIFPVFGLYSPVNASVSLKGDGIYQTYFETTTDLGKDAYVFACGDPTGTPENGRGIYGASGAGAYCYGDWRDFSVSMVGATNAVLGVRPILAGIPIAMNGLLEGPRREMHNIIVRSYNTGLSG